MMKPSAQLDIDRKNPFELAAVQLVKRPATKVGPEVEVDSSAIPPPGDTVSKDAALNPLYRPKKTSTTVRIDSDVLLWLRAQGKGYQSRINKILRRAMIASFKSTETE
jgi:uncharacterized protein (DUF4415 family)